MILAARGGHDPELAEALGIVADHAAEERFAELMGALAQERGKLRRAVAEGHAEAATPPLRRLALPPEATAETLVAGFCAADAGDEAGLRAAAAALAAGSPADRRRGAAIAEWCAAPQRRHEMLAAYECTLPDREG